MYCFWGEEISSKALHCGKKGEINLEHSIIRRLKGKLSKQLRAILHQILGPPTIRVRQLRETQLCNLRINNLKSSPSTLSVKQINLSLSS